MAEGRAVDADAVPPAHRLVAVYHFGIPLVRPAARLLDRSGEERRRKVTCLVIRHRAAEMAALLDAALDELRAAARR
ncbi:hypothetical protein AB0467_11445 [Streptomyces sp. NPDC052095]|uniref:hypothetical protein n=1 Tax=unclassified Streptomyces TaxID=2593676 RepID=UPI0034501982